MVIDSGAGPQTRHREAPYQLDEEQRHSTGVEPDSRHEIQGETLLQRIYMWTYLPGMRIATENFYIDLITLSGDDDHRGHNSRNLRSGDFNRVLSVSIFQRLNVIRSLEAMMINRERFTNRFNAVALSVAPSAILSFMPLEVLMVPAGLSRRRFRRSGGVQPYELGGVLTGMNA